ncbi:MAG TPA: Gfo/Idh/MocA family oxidoreductase, partial [Polyangiaceae bacterium]
MVRSAGQNRVRYAVVGAGNIAQVAVLPAFAHAKETSELAVIVSDDAEKRAALGERYRVKTAAYADFEAVISSERIDAVYIALPNALHRP